MPNWKSILVHAGVGLVCLTAGIWVGSWRANKSHEESFTLNEFLSVEHRVKVLGLLYNNEIDKATNELERRLNVEILVLGPNPYHPRPLDENQLAALRLAAAHRAKHPFSQQSKGINQMVQNALQSTK